MTTSGMGADGGLLAVIEDDLAMWALDEVECSKCRIQKHEAIECEQCGVLTCQCDRTTLCSGQVFCKACVGGCLCAECH